MFECFVFALILSMCAGAPSCNDDDPVWSLKFENETTTVSFLSVDSQNRVVEVSNAEFRVNGTDLLQKIDQLEAELQNTKNELEHAQRELAARDCNVYSLGHMISMFGVCSNVTFYGKLEIGYWNDYSGVSFDNIVVHGDVWMENFATDTNLDILSGLSEVKGDVLLNNNGGSSLTTLNALGNLTSIGGYLLIQGNSGLTDLDGLSSLTSIGGFLYIRDNGALTSLNGLSSLTSIGGYLYIRDNGALTSLNGLSSLTSIGGYLYIGPNAGLTNLDGLSSLKSIGRYLDIYNNNALTNLNGLSSLTSIGGYLRIQANFALTSISGLSGLTTNGAVAGNTLYSPGNALHIVNNDNFNCGTASGLPLIANAAVVNGPRYSTGNANNCGF